jgi:hypothetical protein
MRKVILNWAVTIKISESQRKAIEGLADRQECTLGAAARYIIDAGLRSLDLKH